MRKGSYPAQIAYFFVSVGMSLPSRISYFQSLVSRASFIFSTTVGQPPSTVAVKVMAVPLNSSVVFSASSFLQAENSSVAARAIAVR